MGERGPQSKYTPEERAAQGNPGRRPDDVTNDATALIPADMAPLEHVPPVPDWLDTTSDTGALAANAWRQLAPLLIDARALRESDLHSFARFCRYAAEWVTLTEEIDDKGFTVENSTKFGITHAPNPAIMTRA